MAQLGRSLKSVAAVSTPIHDFLDSYAKSMAVRCHMPGNKGIDFPHDITEIQGADVLYESAESGGIILRSENNAAGLFKAAHTCYSCGGSTLGIQAMLCAVKLISGKRRIAAGRYSHKSLIESAVLLDLDIDWLYPSGGFLSCDIRPETIEGAVTDKTAAVFLTSVDYYGGEADIKSAADICRELNIPLLVDNAHGAYKVFTGDHPIVLGAAMCADSAHKTLPALTGASYLHIGDERFYAAAKSSMSLFGSSSPSYLMLESLDLCNAFIADKSEIALKALEDIKSLKDRLIRAGYTLRKSDAARITVDAAARGYTGYELAALLREKGVECEMADGRYVVLLFSVVQPQIDFERVYEALAAIPEKGTLKTYNMPEIILPVKMSPRSAYFSKKILVPSGQAVGGVCAGIFSPCPPCVPVVMPGEEITADAAEMLKMYGVRETAIVSNTHCTF